MGMILQINIRSISTHWAHSKCQVPGWPIPSLLLCLDHALMARSSGSAPWCGGVSSPGDTILRHQKGKWYECINDLRQSFSYSSCAAKSGGKTEKKLFVIAMILITLINLRLLSLPKAISLAFYLIILIKEIDILWIRFTVLTFSITSSCQSRDED